MANCKLLQAEYFSRYPRGLNPVQINDIVFALHAAFATIITLVQCFIYEVCSNTFKIKFTSFIFKYFIEE